jgi:DNA repair exonuclease SbcCD ATPase subunit
MTTICGTFDAAVQLFSAPFRSCVRTPTAADVTFCANTTLVAASITSIVAGAFYSIPALAAGVIVCPVAVLNACLSSDYSRIQVDLKNVNLENAAMKAVQLAAQGAKKLSEAEKTGGVGVILPATDVAISVSAEDSEIIALRQQIASLQSGETSLRSEVSRLREELAGVSQAKEVLAQDFEELRSENTSLQQTAARVGEEARILSEDSQAKEQQIDRLNAAVKSFQQDVGQTATLTLKLAQLMAIEKALRDLKSADNSEYEALIARFPGLTLPA